MVSSLTIIFHFYIQFPAYDFEKIAENLEFMKKNVLLKYFRIVIKKLQKNIIKVFSNVKK